VVKDPRTHQQVLFEILAAATELGLPPQGLIRSPLVGPKGNIEFLAWLRKGGEPASIERLVSSTS
jgi:23S rRNA (cytidine1920-2'-O)/16S rRNA (cytidine1409-2'-O)-methyltransferase